MKRFTLLFTLFLYLLSPSVKGSGVDSLNITSQFIGVGETWYTDYFTNYAVYTNRSFYKDESGGLHMIFISNYELFYFFSVDNGNTWTEESLESGYEGDVKEAVIYADEFGNPYIGITTNPYFNYGNPTGISYGHEFHYNAYFLYKDEGSWTSETIYISGSDSGWSYNYGFVVRELYAEGDEFVIVGIRYGWYSYGGQLWEFTRSSEGIWSSLNVVVDYNDTPVDHNLTYVYSVLDDDGTKDLVYSRPYNSGGIPEVATVHYDGTNWSIPTQLTTDLYNHGAWDITTNNEGDVWLAHFSNNPDPHIVLYSGLDSSTELSIDLSLVDTIQNVKIHYTADELLDLLVYPYNSDTVVLFVSEDFGATWSEPMYEDRNIVVGIIPVCDQYGDQLPDLEFMRISRVSHVEPFGPDSLFYTHVEQVNTTALGIDQYENVEEVLSFYPNPITDVININYTLKDASELILNIYTLQGKVVFNKNIYGQPGETTTKIDLSHLNAGSYILEVYEKGNPPDGFLRTTKKMLKLNSN